MVYVIHSQTQTTMKTIAFIIPYFGQFNNYFDLWLKSCSYNPTIHWHLFTDCESSYVYPPNVFLHKMTFDKLKKLIQSKFSFEIQLEKPYKLCDFKPAYGDIFYDYIKEYDFWGYCDTDLIWGNIRAFLTEEILNKYDKIFTYGHCCIVKNTPFLNNIYQCQNINRVNFQDILTSKLSYCFDETIYNQIFDENGIAVYKKEPFLDIDFTRGHFRSYPPNKTFAECRNGVLSYKEGTLIFFYNGLDHLLHRKEILYAHFQKRSMRNEITNLLKYNSFSIVPNRFIDYKPNWDNESINKIAPVKRIRWEYIKWRLISTLGMGDVKFYRYKLHKIINLLK